MSQFIATKNFGIIEVDHSWQVAQKQDAEGKLIQQGGHIALLVNGARCHITGNPFESEEEIRDICCFANGEVIPKMAQVLEDTLEWFAHRHDNAGQVIPEISFDANGFPKYVETGAYLETEDEIYQCLKPGPVMTAAIVGLAERRKIMALAEATKPPFEEREQPPVMEHEVAAPVQAKEHRKLTAQGRKKGTKMEKDEKGRFRAKPPVAENQVTA